MHKSCWKNISDVGFQHRFECFISVVSYKSKYVDLKWRKKGLETVNILGINYTTNKLILFSEKLSKMLENTRVSPKLIWTVRQKWKITYTSTAPSIYLYRTFFIVLISHVQAWKFVMNKNVLKIICFGWQAKH